MAIGVGCSSTVSIFSSNSFPKIKAGIMANPNFKKRIGI